MLEKIVMKFIEKTSYGKIKNICEKCAKEKTNKIILNNIYKENYDMGDTGICDFCFNKDEVFCEEIIELKNTLELTAKEWTLEFKMPKIFYINNEINKKKIK